MLKTLLQISHTTLHWVRASVILPPVLSLWTFSLASPAFAAKSVNVLLNCMLKKLRSSLLLENLAGLVFSQLRFVIRIYLKISLNCVTAPPPSTCSVTKANVVGSSWISCFMIIIARTWAHYQIRYLIQVTVTCIPCMHWYSLCSANTWTQLLVWTWRHSLCSQHVLACVTTPGWILTRLAPLSPPCKV